MLYYEGTDIALENMFYFFFKIIVFQLNKEKTIYETRMYSFISFMKLWILTTWRQQDRKSTRLNSSHANISYAVFCLKKKKKNNP